MFLGIHLTLMMGIVPVPVPFKLAEALTGVEVSHSDHGHSGFQLTFEIGRSGPLDLLDYALVTHPMLQPFSRVIVLVRFAVVPKVLMDGVITNIQVAPSSEPGGSTLTVTGEDVSVMMDLEEKSTPHPAMSEDIIVRRILLSYMQYGLIPDVIPPLSLDVPVPTRRIPTQSGTDLQYIQTLAERYNFVFYVKPGPLPGTNTAYWGPQERMSFPQKALSCNMGPLTNTESISFTYDALSPTLVMGNTQDSLTGLSLPVITPPVSTRVPLAMRPAVPFNLPNVRKTLPASPDQNREERIQGLMRSDQFTRREAETALGLEIAQSLARAKAKFEASLDQVVVATGELDSLRYGDLLEARSIVGVRGVGLSYDGNYYVQSVSHSIKKGEYKQRFTLSREGVGSLTPLVRP